MQDFQNHIENHDHDQYNDHSLEDLESGSGSGSLQDLDQVESRSMSLLDQEEEEEEEEIETTPIKPTVTVSPIRKSFFVSGYDVLYFPKEDEQVSKLPKSIISILKWKSTSSTPRVVKNAVQRAGFTIITSGDKFVGYWGKHLATEKYQKFKCWQYINHFPSSFEMGRKDKLWMNYCKARESFHGHYDFCPDSYVLPGSKMALERAFESHPAWIVKPVASARGIGIKVINKHNTIPSKECIVSKYIMDPLLVNGRKFDLRLYVAVVGFDPLRIFFYKFGLARFASEDYSRPSGSKKKSRFAHLTNYSVNKKNKKDQSMDGNKWSLEQLSEYLKSRGVDFNKVMKEVKSLVIKTVFAVQTQNTFSTRMQKANCYELFGFDVLLDENLKPWLMEVNISPAMKGSCDMDYKLKSALVTDLFNLVGFKIDDLNQAKKLNKNQTQEPVRTTTFVTGQERKKHRKVVHECLDPLFELTENDIKKLMDFEDEFGRKGDFECLWPSYEYRNHIQFLRSLNYYDLLLFHWRVRQPDHQVRIQTLRLKIKEAKKTKDVKKISSAMSSMSLQDKILSRLNYSNSSSASTLVPSFP